MKYKVTTLVAALTVLRVLQATPTFAIDDGSCGTMLQEAFATTTRDGLVVPKYNNARALGTFVTARGGSGHHAFAMQQSYQAETGLANSAASAKSTFPLTYRSDTLHGKFNAVFPGRGNGDEDLTTLQIYRDGRAELILDRWGGGRLPLSGVSCYSGHAGVQFILTGYARTPGFGVTVYNFLIDPYYSPLI